MRSIELVSDPMNLLSAQRRYDSHKEAHFLSEFAIRFEGFLWNRFYLGLFKSGRRKLRVINEGLKIYRVIILKRIA